MTTMCWAGGDHGDASRRSVSCSELSPNLCARCATSFCAARIIGIIPLSMSCCRRPGGSGKGWVQEQKGDEGRRERGTGPSGWLGRRGSRAKGACARPLTPMMHQACTARCPILRSFTPLDCPFTQVPQLQTPASIATIIRLRDRNVLDSSPLLRVSP
eukprot:scaffold233911_cov28-Tisochrysis_lutea.AAC.1